MNKIKLNDQDLVAPCGLYCGECEAFQDERCGGCISRKGLCLKYTEICKIYSCCLDEKSLRFCGPCELFPCQRFVNFFRTPAWYDEVVSNLKTITNEGVEKFLKGEVDRVKKLIRCAEEKEIKHCIHCQWQACQEFKRPPLVPD